MENKSDAQSANRLGAPCSQVTMASKKKGTGLSRLPLDADENWTREPTITENSKQDHEPSGTKSFGTVTQEEHSDLAKVIMRK
jgi:hypothetical protein